MRKSKLHTLQNLFEKLPSFFSKPIVRRIIILVFVLQCIYIALTFRFGVPPDELTHIGFIEFYANGYSLSPLIDSQTDKFVFGEMSRDPSYLYHYLMSLLYRVLPVPVLWKYFSVRLVSVALATATILVSVKLAKSLKISDGAINVGLLLVTNFSQFMMMSSVVNNDAAIWLITAVSGYYLLKLYKTNKLSYLLAVAVAVLAGTITKKTFLPLGLLFSAIGALLAFRNYKLLFTKQQLRNWTNLLLAGVFIVMLGLFTERILGNLVKYQTIDPICDEINTVDQCRGFGIYGRNEYFIRTRPDDAKLLPLERFVPYWYFQSIDSTIDIDTQFWAHYIRPPMYISFVLCFVAILGFWETVKYAFKNRRKQDGKIYFVFAGAVATIVTANLVLNYYLYDLYARLGLAIHGRYLFAVIVPFCIVSAYFIGRKYAQSKYLAPAIGFVLCAVIVPQTGLLFLLRHDQFTTSPLQPTIIFDPDNAVRGPSSEKNNLNVR